MRHYKNFDLCDYNSYRIKASCKNAFFPDSERDLQQLFTARKSIPKIILGGGYNVILSKTFYQEDFVIFQDCFNDVESRGTDIEAGCGLSLRSLSETALACSLAGVELFYDIPGSIGGAVIMNAGAGGEEIKDIVEKIRFYDIERNTFSELINREASFGYRSSYFQGKPNLLVTRAWFKLREGKSEQISKKMEQLKQDRWEKQPREYPNAGSVFKRPAGHYVGALLDELRLKGFRVGDAMVSEKHSGFIVNVGDATGDDILSLINEIRLRVRNKFGIDLVLEQKVL